jgi:hypothetical protein
MKENEMSNKTHWINPWPDAIPVDLETLATIVCKGSGKTLEEQIAYWKQSNEKLDAYLLPDGIGTFIHAGVRFGNAGENYYSPYVHSEETQVKLRAMLETLKAQS